MTLNLTDGFGHYYRADTERVHTAFNQGLIVLDTNVLLNILRYSPSAREELLDVIAGIADRCFVPYQIALEYNRNRVPVVAARHKELSEAEADIDSLRSTVRTLVNRLRDRRILPTDEVSKLEESATGFVEALANAAGDAWEQYDLDPAQMVGRFDLWTAKLSSTLEGKVSERPTDEALEADQREATRRREEKLAPGFKDDAGGDYLWWAEVLRWPGLQERPLVVVSDDAAKGDWRFEQHGIAVGPHSILTQDVLEAGGTDLILLTTRDFLQLAEDLGSSQVSQSTIAESEQVLETRRAEWTLRGYVDLINALESEGYGVRADVIRAAAGNDGNLDREAVYEIAGISEADRSLRQFATPVQRLTRHLEEAGLVHEDAPDALKAEYDGPGKASGYSVPAEFVDFEQIVLASEHAVAQQATTDWSARDQVRAQMRSSIKRRAQARTQPEDANHIAEVLLSRAETGVTPPKPGEEAN